MEQQRDSIVLVADDEERFRSALVDILRFFGHDVMEAKTGQELEQNALSVIEKCKSYALVVDNQMPEQQGEPEEQWCGFRHIMKLCSNNPARNLGAHVLFLSRWGLVDLPEVLLQDAKQYGLAEEEQWWSVYTPYTILKGHIERVLKG